MQIQLFSISPLRESHRSSWERLARAYHVFDHDLATDDEIERTWRRLMAGNALRAIGAFTADGLVGIAHFHMHEHMWHGTVCYLEDLFVDESERSRGTGRALIEAVANTARADGCFRLYWVTKGSNTRARQLYDRIAVDTGYVRYDVPLHT